MAAVHVPCVRCCFCSQFLPWSSRPLAYWPILPSSPASPAPARQNAKTVKAAGVPLEIVLQDGGKPLRLEIPRGLLPKDSAVRGGLFGGLDSFRTIVAGLALLAVVVAGLWLVRRFAVSTSRPLPKAATVATIVTLVVAGLAVASAGRLAATRRTPAAAPPEVALKLQIEVVDEENG